MLLLNELLRRLFNGKPVPKYVDDGLIYPPPHSAQGVKMFGFFFEGDYDKIKAYVDARFNLPENNVRHYTPVTHYVMLTFQHTDHLTAGPPFDKRGYFQYTELALWIPMVAMVKVLGKWIPDPFHPVFFAPYLFLNNDVAISGGREIFGMEKQWGQISMPKDHNDPAPFSVDVFALKTFSPESQGQVMRFMDITRDASVETRPDTVWSSLSEAFRAVFQEFSAHMPFKIDIKLPENLFELHIPLAFMKQFRAIENNTDACYQAIVELSAAVDNLSGWSLQGDYEMTLQSLATQPWFDQFGIKLQQKALIKFWLEFDMKMGFGKTIWGTSNV